ncbi:PilW family protein [Glaciimonas sp. PAMC28666]|uniref:PilW family protein n=1 Tax=Glaciimonas sp. PAMC28666 TaxID=2807626 RepID=UPI001F034960|nr:PilW family protein [Glaciimonas sp. PAMC28666]
MEQTAKLAVEQAKKQATKHTIKSTDKRFGGFSLIELLIAMTLGLFLVGAIISVYLAETQIYKSTNSQATIQNAENAIAGLVTPVIRSAGFNGCSSLAQSLSNLTAGAPPPLGTLTSNSNAVFGYQGGGATLTIAQDNAANDVTASDWSPALDATLVGKVQAGSDVLVLLGAMPNTAPVGVTVIPLGGTTMTLQNTTGLAVGQLGIVSDCLKSSIFQITAIAGNTITHAAGGGAVGTNSTSVLAVNYQLGALFVPLQQTAFYVAQGVGGDQSTLMRSTFSNGAWTNLSLVPGVEAMQVLYGIGTNNVLTQYVPASAVTDWTQVYSVRIGFLIQGQLGSATTSSATPAQFKVLNTTVTVPADGRLRHIYEITINLRNAA